MLVSKLLGNLLVTFVAISCNVGTSLSELKTTSAACLFFFLLQSLLSENFRI